MKKEILCGGCLLAACSWTVFAEPEATALTKPPDADGHTILLLHFDDVKDGIAKDASGRNNHGQITGAKLVPGKVGQALQFDGDDDFVDGGGERGERPDLDFGDQTDFTVEFWFKTTTTNRYAHLINKKCRPDATEPGWTIYLHLGRVKALIADGVNQIALSQEAVAGNDGAWHHVALVADRQGDAVLFVDGQSGVAIAMKGLLDITNNNRRLRIGDRAHDGDYEGMIDEVRISRIARQF
jgi:hypothetical protein